MADPVTVPRLGWSMEEGTFVEWLKRDGDRIEPGDPLFVLESDKAAENIEAIDAGILRLDPDGPKPGEKVLVGQVLAHLVAEGEEAPAIARTGPPPQPAAPGPLAAGNASGNDHGSGNGNGAAAHGRDPRRVGDERPGPHEAVVVASPGRKRAVSPRARRAADELGVDLATVRGGGRTGRIRERDVREAARRAGEGRLVPHTPARKLVAARMVAGVTQAAPVTLTTKADATNLVGLRAQFKASAGSPDDVPSYNDFLVTLAAAALKRHPRMQAQWREEGLFLPDRIHVGVAVDAEAGLLVPVIRDADKLTLRQVAAQSRELIARAREGRLTADRMRDATFTVTNLGMFGVDAFTPIVNLPQPAILGVGRIVREPAVVGDAMVPRDVVTFSLTFDHRVLDGGPAARFLDDFRRRVEQPAPWLVP